MKTNTYVRWQAIAAILLACAGFYSCAPAPTLQNADAVAELRPAAPTPSAEWEEARQIWNGVKMLKKQMPPRLKRFVSSVNPTTVTRTPVTPLDYGLANVSAPAYIKELYLNLSRQDAEDNDATIIRSLPALHTEEGNGCGFNFSFSSVSPYEIFRRAELRIHMKQPSGDRVNTIFLQLYHGTRPISKKLVSPSREGWVVFDLLHEVDHWKARLTEHPHKQIHLSVLEFTKEEDLMKTELGKNCHDSSIQFNRPFDSNDDDSFDESIARDKQPLLMVYSFDPNTINFNLSALIEAANASSGTQEPTRRAARQTRGCQQHSLTIDRNTFNEIWHLGDASQTAIFPSSFPINVCGGHCENNVPVSTAQHSIVLYYLSTRRHPLPVNELYWGQCCAPVKYRNIETLFSLPGGEFQIVQLREMSVEQCTCLNILKSR